MSYTKKLVFYTYARTLHFLVWKVKNHILQTLTSHLAHGVRPTGTQHHAAQRRLSLPRIRISNRSVPSNLTESDTVVVLCLCCLRRTISSCGHHNRPLRMHNVIPAQEKYVSENYFSVFVTEGVISMSYLQRSFYC